MDERWPLALGIISVILQVFAFLSPGWLRFMDFERSFNLGLWYMCVPSCMAYGSDDYDYIHDSILGILEYMASGYWFVFRLEATIALITGFIGILLILGSAKRKWSYSKMFKAYAMIVFLGSGIALWVPAATFVNIHEAENAGRLYVMFPYSVVIAGIAASLTFIVALLLLIDLCTKKKSSPVEEIRVEEIRSPLPPTEYFDCVYISQPMPGK